MKNYVLLILLLTYVNLLTAQEQENYYDPFSKEQMLPPSPSVVSLDKFGDIPVSIYTGIATLKLTKSEITE